MLIFLTSFTGTVTTSTALYALVAQWANQPDIQTKAQQEIHDVIGDRHVCLQDRAKMPYMDAMLLELLRLISHVPLSVPHETTRDTTIQGHKIPKGVTVSVTL